MKTARRMISLLLCLMLLFIDGITMADTVLDDDARNYRTSNFLGMLAITGYTGKETKLAFPAELNGKKVVQIGSGNNDRAFYYNDFVEITIPEGVEAIADYTFADCKTLRIIEIPGSVRQIAPPETLFAGIGDDYKYITIRTPRGSTADKYAQKYNMLSQYVGTMETPTPTEQINITVPVYYLGENNEIVARDTVILNQSGIVGIKESAIPAGYILAGGSEIYVNVQDRIASPNPILFQLRSLPSMPTPFVLQKPTNLHTMKEGQTEVTLSWNKVDKANKYEVAYRKKGASNWTVYYNTLGLTTITVIGLLADTTYDFRVTAISDGVRSEGAELSKVKTLAPTPTPTPKPTPTPFVPQKPTNLRKMKEGQTEITLTWNRVDKANKYEVAYKKNGASNWTIYKAISSLTVTVTGLLSDTTYDFRVTAISGGVRSEGAELLKVKTLAPTPTPTPKPTPTPIPPLNDPTTSLEKTEEQVRISVGWKGGISPYEITLYPYINSNHNKEEKYVALKKAKNNQVTFDKNLTPGQTYWIRIADNAGQELWSKYTFPQMSLDGFTAKLEYVFFEDRNFGNNGYTSNQLGKNKISKKKLVIKHRDSISTWEMNPETLVKLTGNHSDLFQEYPKADLWGFTLVQPNGLLLVGELSCSRYTNNTQKHIETDLVLPVSKYINGYQSMFTQLIEDYQGWQNIPAGKYTIIISFGNYFVGSQEITITE